MADLEITADVSSVTRAEKSINAFQNQLNRLFKKYQSGSVTQDAYKKGLLDIKRAYSELGVSSQKASGQVEKYTRELQKSAAAQKRAADNKDWLAAQRNKIKLMEESNRLEQRAVSNAEKLRAKYVPLYAASKQYEKALEEINQAHAQGILTAAQYEGAVEKLNAEYNQLQAAGVGNVRGMNNLGVAMQQTGYQVGDFLVQVQSGTNGMVAFGQQATQLVGILPMFGDALGISASKLIAVSAGLGIVIPLLTAAGAYFMRTKKDAEEAGDAYEGVGQALDALEAVRLSDFGHEFANYARTAREEFETILGVIEQVESKKLQDTITAPLRALIAEIESFDFQERIAGQLGEIDYESAFGLQTRNEALFLAEQLNRLDGDTKEELQAQLESIAEAVQLRGIMTDEVQATLAALASEISLVEDLTAETERRRALHSESNALIDTFKRIVGSISIDNLLTQFDALNSKIGSAIFGAGTLSARLRRAFDETVALAQANADMRKAQEEGFRFPTGTTEGNEADPFWNADIPMTNMPEVTGEFGLAPVKSSKSGGSSRRRSSGGSSRATEVGNGVFSFMQQFMDEGEKLEVWREEQLKKLQDFNEKELEILRQHGINRATIEEEYQKRVGEIKRAQLDTQLGHYESFFGTMASVLQQGGEKGLKISKAFALAEAAVSIARGAAKALELPFPANMAAWASVIATGAQALSTIRGTTAGSGSLPGGGSGGGGSIATPAASAPTPQRVLIEGLGANDLITGAQLSEIFDKLYEENENRGLVFQVST